MKLDLGGIAKGYGVDQSINILKKMGIKQFVVNAGGDYERYFIKNGKRYCHIINPKTGYPGDLVQSVTVMAQNATYADALVTAIFLMGPDKGMKLVESLNDVETLIIDQNGRANLSSGFRK